MKILPIIVFVSALTLKLKICHCIYLNPSSDENSNIRSFKSFLDRNFEYDTSCLKQFMLCFSVEKQQQRDTVPSPECYKVEYYNMLGSLDTMYLFIEQPCEYRALECYRGVTAMLVSKEHCLNFTSALPWSIEQRFNPLNGEDYILKELADRKEMIRREFHRNDFNTPLPRKRLTSHWRYNYFNVRNGVENQAINSVSQIISAPLFIFILLFSYVV